MSAAYLCPILQEPQFTDDVNFLAGGLMWFYYAGTTTPLAVYTDGTATTAWPNPVVLNARGESGGEFWLQAGQSYKIVLEGIPLYGQTHGPLISTYDNVSGVNDSNFIVTFNDWTAFPGTPTYLSYQSFSVTSDQRSIFQVNRRIKATCSAGLQYGTIVSVSYAVGITTVTLRMDATSALDAGLSSVQYGFIETTPSSIPQAVQTGTTTAGSSHQIYIDYNGTNLTVGVDGTEFGSTWPISEFASGTTLVFYQASAPTGWTQVTSYNDYALRLVSDSTGGSTGGSVAFSTAFASQAVSGTVGGYSLQIGDLPAHSHGINDPGHSHGVSDPGHHHTYAMGLQTNAYGGGSLPGTNNNNQNYNTSAVGTGISINGATTGISTQNTGSGNAHTHSFTGTAINLAVQYANVILCSKN